MNGGQRVQRGLEFRRVPQRMVDQDESHVAEAVVRFGCGDLQSPVGAVMRTRLDLRSLFSRTVAALSLFMLTNGGTTIDGLSFSTGACLVRSGGR